MQSPESLAETRSATTKKTKPCFVLKIFRAKMYHTEEGFINALLDTEKFHTYKADSNSWVRRAIMVFLRYSNARTNCSSQILEVLQSLILSSIIVICFTLA